MVGLPDGVALTSAFASQLLASRLHVTIRAWVLFLVILAAVAGLAYLGIGTSSWADLVLVAAEMAVIAALVITILTKASPANFSADAFSAASAPHGQWSDNLRPYSTERSEVLGERTPIRLMGIRGFPVRGAVGAQNGRSGQPEDQENRRS